MISSVLVKLITGFIGLLVVVRFVGKKSLSKMTPLDLIYSIVLGGIVEEAIYDDKVKSTEILIALSAWAFMIYIFELLVSNSKTLSEMFQGKASVVIHRGKLIQPAIRKNKIEMQQLRQMLRSSSCFSLQNADTLIIENGGSISLTKKDDNDDILAYLLIDGGDINQKVLKSLNISEEEVVQEIKAFGLEIKDIKYCEWSPEKEYYILSDKDLIKEEIFIE